LVIGLLLFLRIEFFKKLMIDFRAIEAVAQGGAKATEVIDYCQRNAAALMEEKGNESFK